MAVTFSDEPKPHIGLPTTVQGDLRLHLIVAVPAESLRLCLRHIKRLLDEPRRERRRCHQYLAKNLGEAVLRFALVSPGISGTKQGAGPNGHGLHRSVWASSGLARESPCCEACVHVPIGYGSSPNTPLVWSSATGI